MADTTVPYFKNDAGVKVIRIGAKEFKCTGAAAPFDHPHVYLDMGDDAEIVCPYCSTLYKYDGSMALADADPPECAYQPGELV